MHDDSEILLNYDALRRLRESPVRQEELRAELDAAAEEQESQRAWDAGIDQAVAALPPDHQVVMAIAAAVMREQLNNGEQDQADADELADLLGDEAEQADVDLYENGPEMTDEEEAELVRWSEGNKA